MVANKHKVGVKQWKKWSDLARRTFNRMYEMARDQSIYNAHPRSTILPPECWSTIAWNVAWEAADLADADGKKYSRLVMETKSYRPPTKRAA